MAEGVANRCFSFARCNGSRPQIQFGHSLLAVHPNCLRKNELGMWVSPQTAPYAVEAFQSCHPLRAAPLLPHDVAGGQPDAVAT
jgi:hypothetical protein